MEESQAWARKHSSFVESEKLGWARAVAENKQLVKNVFQTFSDFMQMQPNYMHCLWFNLDCKDREMWNKSWKF